MHEIILCKLGEVVLKGLNRHSFEMKLMSTAHKTSSTAAYSSFSSVSFEKNDCTCFSSIAVVSRTEEMNMIASGIYPYLALSVIPCRGLTDLLRPMGGRKFAQHPVGAALKNVLRPCSGKQGRDWFIRLPTVLRPVRELPPPRCRPSAFCCRR